MDDLDIKLTNLRKNVKDTQKKLDSNLETRKELTETLSAIATKDSTAQYTLNACDVRHTGDDYYDIPLNGFEDLYITAIEAHIKRLDRIIQTDTEFIDKVNSYTDTLL